MNCEYSLWERFVMAGSFIFVYLVGYNIGKWCEKVNEEEMHMRDGSKD